MNILLKKTSLFIVVVFFSLLSTHTFAADQTLPTFKAEYKLSHNNIEIGHVSLNVKMLANGQYQLLSSTETSGLLAFVRDDIVLESSRFELTEKQVRPLSYEYQQTLGDDKKNIKLHFDWQTKTLTNSSKGHDWRLTLSNGVLDKALLQLALMQDLKNPAEKSLSYQVADGGKLKTYSFTQLGDEQIKVAGKQYQTIKLARKKDDKPLITYYWCAKELHNLPILLQRKKTYGTFEMRLLSAHFDN